MAGRSDWAAAYARQSQSDFRVYQILLSLSEIEECHRLHYLQMACEKIAKAFLFRDTATGVERLFTEHVAFSRFIEGYLRSPELKSRYKGNDSRHRQVIRFARLLAREIEKLAPAVDRAVSPANSEYPWIDGEKIVVPCNYGYPNLVRLRDPGGRYFLKLIKVAIEEFNDVRMT